MASSPLFETDWFTSIVPKKLTSVPAGIVVVAFTFTLSIVIYRPTLSALRKPGKNRMKRTVRHLTMCCIYLLSFLN